MIERTAIISKDGQYRYWLEREFKGLFTGPLPLVFCMLNPSTADGKTDDATIRRCISFAQRENASGVVVVNLFALRSTSPATLMGHVDPVGPRNTEFLEKAVEASKDAFYDKPQIVCAWGDCGHRKRQEFAVNLFRKKEVKLMCLGTSNLGFPRHPLYVKKTQKLEEWKPNI